MNLIFPKDWQTYRKDSDPATLFSDIALNSSFTPNYTANRIRKYSQKQSPFFYMQSFPSKKPQKNLHFTIALCSLVTPNYDAIIWYEITPKGNFFTIKPISFLVFFLGKPIEMSPFS